MTKQEAAKKYSKNDARYLLCSNSSGMCVDARYSNYGVGQFVNSASGSVKAADSRDTDRHLNIKSNRQRKIKAGRGITMAYGSDHTICSLDFHKRPQKEQ